MDHIAHYNLTRWQALAKANALFTRPYLNLDAATAQARIDPDKKLGELRGKNVLCLAGGGGQQSAAFSVVGAAVTVVDLSDDQLQKDRAAAAHYKINIHTVQGDMRDLSVLEANHFDIVWQPYSINFVPEARQVFKEVARVIRRDGVYRFNCANPFVSGLTEKDWNGEGYPLKYPYRDGFEMTYPDSAWVYDQTEETIPQPREFRHTLSTLINGLIEHSFVIREVSDSTDFSSDENAAPGTWEHFTAIAPPWLTFWTEYHP
jgi:ubiquinone/menaquinone biosynthesis C-methylase UbiE